MKLSTRKAAVHKPWTDPTVSAANEQPEAISDDIAEKIRATLAEAIAEGALKPGVKLLEDVIAEHFGVSRTIVRGALAILQREHLVERKRNRGSFVAEPSVADAHHLFDARRAIELAILERVVPRADAAALDRLEALTREEERIHSGADEAAKSKLSGHFHVELARLSGNVVLAELLAKIVARISLVMALYERHPADGCGAQYHRQIIEALRRKDAALACQRMDEHLSEMESRVRLDEAQGDRHSLVSVLERFSRSA
jgi:DNA-binding GntR family transcriptional regulator